ncbi:MAG: sigma-70 family RNA polymerase sigma factor [Candidatus Marinimicrobia bacterium]|nr:sigma-70 family RNA polymerase sigma factor [Candidatus Neomarinimicrobiota bacterium]
MSPDNLYERGWENKIIQQSVLTLPRDERMAISLFYYFDNSYEKIAVIMEIPIGTVKSHIHRSKKKLKVILEPILEKSHE